MRLPRRAALMLLATAGLAGSASLATATPLQGLNSAAALIAASAARRTDNSGIDQARWHRHRHHHHWHRHWHRHWYHHHRHHYYY